MLAVPSNTETALKSVVGRICWGAIVQRRVSVSLALVAMMLGLVDCSHQADELQNPPPSIFIGAVKSQRIAVPIVASDHSPQLVALALSSVDVHSGDTVSGWAVTSSNVASVVARVEGYAVPLHRNDFGRFSLQVHVPSLPSFVKRDYDLSVAAINSGGREAKAVIPIHVR